MRDGSKGDEQEHERSNRSRSSRRSEVWPSIPEEKSKQTRGGRKGGARIDIDIDEQQDKPSAPTEKGETSFQDKDMESDTGGSGGDFVTMRWGMRGEMARGDRKGHTFAPRRFNWCSPGVSKRSIGDVK